MDGVCQAAVDLVKEFEGFRSKAYTCPANVPTIGYGHTGPDVKMADVGRKAVTMEEAWELLRTDLTKAAADVDELVKVPLTRNQRGALASFVFNLGSGSFARSTLLRVLNQGDYVAAAEQFRVWDKAKVKGALVTLGGLSRRRAAECLLFCTPDTQYPAVSEEGE